MHILLLRFSICVLYVYFIFNLNTFYNSSILNHYSIIVYHKYINIIILIYIMLTNINKQNDNTYNII